MDKAFKSIVREVVKEELAPVEKRLSKKIDENFFDFKEEIIGSIKKIMSGFKNDLISIKVEIMGELKANREQQTILNNRSMMINDLEERVEELEKIPRKFAN